MLQLWIAAALLLVVGCALVAWAIADRNRLRGLLSFGGALLAFAGLAFIVYAMVVFCEAPPGSACA